MSGAVAFAAENLRGHGGKPLSAKIAKKSREGRKVADSLHRRPIGPDELRMLDADMKWVVEPGVFRVMVGASSKDIRLRGQLTVR